MKKTQKRPWFDYHAFKENREKELVDKDQKESHEKMKTIYATIGKH